MRGNSHVRCEAGEKVEIISKPYLSLLYQLHNIGVEGVNPWNAFYETVSEYFGQSNEVVFHFYGNNVPREMDGERFEKRERFFNALQRHNIQVFHGFSVIDSQNRLLSKGIDVLMSINMLDLAREGYEDIILATASSNLVPAIKRIQERGVKVRAIVSENVPAGKLTSAVNYTISLEEVLGYLPSKNLKWMKESVIA